MVNHLLTWLTTAAWAVPSAGFACPLNSGLTTTHQYFHGRIPTTKKYTKPKVRLETETSSTF